MGAGQRRGAICKEREEGMAETQAETPREEEGRGEVAGVQAAATQALPELRGLRRPLPVCTLPVPNELTTLVFSYRKGTKNRTG